VPTPAEFVAKWQGVNRPERAAAQGHFIYLCAMLGVPTPNEADPNGVNRPGARESTSRGPTCSATGCRPPRPG
jgi:hypothetical protein